MRKRVIGLLSLVLIVAIVATMWHIGHLSPTKSKTSSTPSEASVKPVPARTQEGSASAASPTGETNRPVATVFPATSGSTQPASLTSTPVAPTTPSIVAGPAQSTPIDEEMATRRMYAAHAPLRTPGVADPDSTGNRQILQTMVQKALAQTQTTEPGKP